ALCCARGRAPTGRDKEGGGPPQADIAGREAVEGTLLDFDDRRNRLRPDRAGPQDPLLPELDQPAAPAVVGPEQGPLALGPVDRLDDDPVTLLEPAPAAEHHQGAGAPVAVGGAADTTFGAV